MQQAPLNRPAAKPAVARKPYFAHETAVVGDPAQIGANTRIWHFSHIMAGATVGRDCIFGQNCHVAAGAVVGNNVKVQNNVSIYAGALIEDDVFLGPSCVLTNVSNPRSQVNRHSLYETTVIRRGVTVGANATVVCGIELGRYAFVAAGAVVTKNVADYALMAGSPARRIGWMSRHAHRLENPDRDGIMVCPESGYRYREVRPGALRCLDLDEDSPLPADLSMGAVSYRELKRKVEEPVTLG
jgi:UDP-2-acetamido-3-amino-2,3-dideoxy-glucuronate N-acetyltransferase